MSGTSDLVNDHRPKPGGVDGVIASNPTSVDEPVDVIVVGLNDREYRERDCPWMPRVDDDGAVVYPEEDNPCVVVYTDSNTPWVVGYVPGTEVPHG